MYNQKIMYLCNVIRNKSNNKNQDFMTKEELKAEIEKKEQMLADYQKIAKLIKVSPEEWERQVNLLLDDLIELRKQIEK